MNSPVPAYVFGPFRLLPLERQLFDGERAVRVGSRAMDLLLALLERAGEIVDKQDLLAIVWHNAVVDDSTLRVHLAALRKVLRDGHDGQRYITTVPGRGYGFLAPLEHTGHPAPADQAPAEPQDNLPVLLTRVVGRDDIVQAMANHLQQQRLLCIAGPGGIGKTTVAVALARRVLRRHADGGCFVDLAPLSDGHLAPLALAAALGVSVPASDPMPGLLAHLRQRHILVVLDNCDHVVAAAAALADTLLKHAPHLHLVVTCREPLRIAGEQLQRLPALELPPLHGMHDAAALRHFAAVQLFIERCKTVHAGFALADAELPVVVEICRRLDGIPLALELAAGRIAHFGLHELRRQLDDCLRLLVRGPRNWPLRHQTLRATLDWSHGLLDDEERSVLRALSVFRSRFQLASADAVADRDVYECMAELAAKSFISVEFCRQQVYYRLLDTTRSYASAQLALAGEQHAVYWRHARHCLQLAERIAGEWGSMPAAAWVVRHGRHIDDLRAAIDWAFGAADNAALGVALTLSAQTLFYQLSLLDEYRVRVELALARMASVPIADVGLEMQLHASLAHLQLYTQGVSGAMLLSFQRSHDLAMQGGVAERQAQAICGMWLASMALADYRRADICIGSFALLPQTGSDTAMQLLHARMRASSEHMQGRHAVSAELSRMVLAQHADTGHFSFNSVLLADHQVCLRGNLARCLWLLGQPDDALLLAREAVAVGFEHNGVSLCAALAFSAIPVALWCGQLAQAQAWNCLLREHVERLGLLYWRGWSDGYQQLLDAETGHAVLNWPGAARWPMQIDMMATLHDAAADAAALRRVEEGMAPWMAAEVLRRSAHRAWLALAPGDNAGLDAVRQRLETALQLARDQGALGWQLRCATSLARVLAQLQRCAEACALLQAVYGRYAQGHDSADLAAAAALLASLQSEK